MRVRPPVRERDDAPVASDASDVVLLAIGSAPPAAPPPLTSSSSLRRALSLRLTPFGRLRERRLRELARASAARATADAACESSSYEWCERVGWRLAGGREPARVMWGEPRGESAMSDGARPGPEPSAIGAFLALCV